jgi:hypothetical protein
MYRFYTWAIDIDDLPINSGDFPLRYVKNQQRVNYLTRKNYGIDPDR